MAAVAHSRLQNGEDYSEQPDRQNQLPIATHQMQLGGRAQKPSINTHAFEIEKANPKSGFLFLQNYQLY